MFGYGALGVILVLYLAAAGLDAGADRRCCSRLTLVGDTLISLWLTTHADRIGRRRTLLIGALLMAAAGARLRRQHAAFVVLLVAATLGVLSPSGQRGRAVPADRAGVAHRGHRRPRAGRASTPGTTSPARSRPRSGALVAGVVVGALRGGGRGRSSTPTASILLGYAVVGLALVPIVRSVSPAVEVPPVDTSIARRFGLHRSRGIVGRLSALFALDAFARRPGHPEPARVLVPRRGSGSPVPVARRDLLRREPPGRRVGARGGADRGAASGSSTRWSSRTCRRTCC